MTADTDGDMQIRLMHCAFDNFFLPPLSDILMDVSEKGGIILAELIKLYLAFFKIGAFTFGGGYAMLPMLQREIVDKNHWATEEELMDYYAIGQCTPGVIAVNTATFIGYKKQGIPGAIFATLGVISPSLIIIMLIAAFFQHFQDLEIVQHAFNGIRVAVSVLIIMTVIKMVRKAVVDIWTLIIAIAIFVLGLLTGISPVIYVVAAGVLGLIIYLRRGAK